MAGEVRRLDYNDMDMDESDFQTEDEGTSIPHQMGDSVLDSLRAALAAPIKRPPVVFTVPERPSISIQYSTTVDAHILQQWRRKAILKRRGGPVNVNDEPDALRFSCLLLAGLCEAIMFDGRAATDKNGNPLTFISPETLDMTGVLQPVDAVRRVYGTDAHVLRTAEQVVTAAGFGDDVEDEGDENPTAVS